MFAPLPLLAAALAIALVTAACTDLRHRIIPNRLNLAIALSAPFAWWAAGLSLWPDVALQLLAGLMVFGGCIILFALGAMGGGDVKLLGALALWLPVGSVGELLAITAVGGGVVTIATLAWHRLRKGEGRPEVPYGVAIAAAGLLILNERYFYHFG